MLTYVLLIYSALGVTETLKYGGTEKKVEVDSFESTPELSNDNPPGVQLEMEVETTPLREERPEPVEERANRSSKQLVKEVCFCVIGSLNPTHSCIHPFMSAVHQNCGLPSQFIQSNIHVQPFMLLLPTLTLYIITNHNPIL